MDDTCTHPTRRRHNDLGWHSRETLCVDCGQLFDPAQEERLRERVTAGREPVRWAGARPWPQGRDQVWRA
jgi:hypothetical protein